jgi:HPr kinase/phosphorylase
MPPADPPIPSDLPERISSEPGITVAVRAVLEHPDVAGQFVLVAGAAGLDRRIEHPRIQKSGLVLVGHTTGMVATRIQVLGETEISYLETLDPATRDARVRFLCDLGLSAIVVSRGVAPLPELLAHAERSGTPLIVSPVKSSSTINVLHAALDRLMAPRARIHAVLVEVHGLGMLLRGPSGIGKSETALLLVEAGHRLIADDMVELIRLPLGAVIGSPAPLLRHHLEIRGVGILNIRYLFGATAVRDEARVELIVDLCPFRDDEDYERLGLDEQTESVLGTPIPRLKIPVRPGRDMGVILQIAARNHLLKREGVHGARRFAERLQQAMDQAGED